MIDLGLGIGLQTARRFISLSPSNVVVHPNDLTAAGWTLWTGITGTANSTDVPDPNGNHTSTKLVYNGLDVAGDLAAIRTTGSATIGQTWRMSMWIRCTTATHVQLSQDLGPLSGDLAVPANRWAKISLTQTASGSATLQFDLWRGASDNAARTFYVWGCQQILIP